jgi:hypothetical protein
MQVDPKRLAEVCGQFAAAFQGLANFLDHMDDPPAPVVQEEPEKAKRPRKQDPPQSKEEPREMASEPIEADAVAKSAKRERQPKDPNAPKKPSSAYWLFYQEQAPRVKAELAANPSADGAVPAGKIGQLWEKADKAPYIKRYEQLLEEYHAKLVEYENSTLPVPQASESVVVESDSKENDDTCDWVPEQPKKRRSKKHKMVVSAEQDVATMASEPVNAPEPTIDTTSIVEMGSEGVEKKKKKKRRMAMESDNNQPSSQPSQSQ